MAKRRVVITGLGLVTSLGEQVDQVWDALLAGQSGIVTIRRWDTSTYPTKFGGECFGFDLTKYKEAYARHKRTDEDEIPRAGRLDRFAQFGIAASISAVNDSGLDFKAEDSTRCGVIIGTGIGGIETIEEQNKILNGRGVSRVSPFTVPRLMANAASGNVSILFRMNGPNTCVSTACATGSNAIGDAARLIQHDLADVMVAGGAEAALSALGMATFVAARALSTRNEEPTKASRPWDKDRDGFVQSEGAGVVILEEYEHAVKRGAKIYCEVVGYGMSGDGYHITAPDEQGRGAAQAMRLALKDAGVTPDVVDYINAHGTSTELGDLAETKALKTVLGDHAYKVAISSTKSQLGHSLGASGGVEAVIASLAVQRNLVPPTINLDNPSPDCDLDYTPHTPKDRKIEYAMSNSFGFGGHNATLLLKKM
ncbi:MAG: 3-oxoacyl-(acyl-carrier-protein) synthase [Phycisphaerales bacterium]|nr:3-oxoacyl-(acyl-carrier-protein) synthase [Phycisphaerales bacterium]